MSESFDINLMSFSVMYTNHHVRAWIRGKEGEGKPKYLERDKLINSLARERNYDFLCFQHVNVDRDARYNCQFHLVKSLDGFATLYPSVREVDEIEDFVPIFFNANKWALDPIDHGIVWFDLELPEKQKHSIGGQVFSYGLFHQNKNGLNASVYVYNARLRNCNDPIFMLQCISQLRQHMKGKDHPVILAIDTQGNEKSNIVKSLLGDDVLVNGTEFSGGEELYDVVLTQHPEMFGKLRSQHNYQSPEDMSGGGMNDRVVITPGFSIKKASLNGYNADGAYPSYHYPVDVQLSFFPLVFMDLLYKFYLCRKPSFKEQQGHLRAFLKDKSLSEIAESRVQAVLSSKEYERKKNTEYRQWDENDKNKFFQVRESLGDVGYGPLTRKAMLGLEAFFI